jgi:hypothetical protein
MSDRDELEGAFWTAAAPIMPVSMTDAISAGIDAIEPLIRADERADIAHRAQIALRDKDERIVELLEDRAAVAEQIAQECESEAKRYRGEDADYGAGLRQAGAIARRFKEASDE